MLCLGGNGNAAAAAAATTSGSVANNGGPGAQPIEELLAAMVRGSQLRKHGRHGRPKYHLFRLVDNLQAIQWESSKGKVRSVRLANVLRVQRGAGTLVFQRTPPPPQQHALALSVVYRDEQASSLLFAGGQRSLDLVCSNAAELDVWLRGLAHAVARARGATTAPCTSSSSSAAAASAASASPAAAPAAASTSNRSAEAVAKAAAAAAAAAPAAAAPKSAAAPLWTSDFEVRTGEEAKWLCMKPFRKGWDKRTSDGIQLLSSGEFDRGSSLGVLAPMSTPDGPMGEPDVRREIGETYVWGSWSAHASTSTASSVPGGDERVRPSLIRLSHALDVVQAAAGGAPGEQHAVLLTRGGELYSWGCGAGGKLGHGSSSSEAVPTRVDALAGRGALAAACGHSYTAAVLSDGSLLTWGTGLGGQLGRGDHAPTISAVPTRVPFGLVPGVPLRVAIISAGPYHAAAVGEDGTLYTWGDGAFGKLGHGSQDRVYTPRLVEGLRDSWTTAVSCGWWHTAAVAVPRDEFARRQGVIGVDQDASLAESWPPPAGHAASVGGALFTWGGDFSWSRSQWHDDHQGALGHGDLDGRLVPTQVLGEDDVRQVAAGRGFTVALNGLGQVLQMGATGAIGRRRGDARALWEGARTPVIVGGPLAAMRAEVIAAGEAHVLAACTVRRGGSIGPGVASAAAFRLVAWGVNSRGQLGCSSSDDHAVPQFVIGLNGRRIRHLAAGGTFSVAVAERDSSVERVDEAATAIGGSSGGINVAAAAGPTTLRQPMRAPRLDIGPPPLLPVSSDRGSRHAGNEGRLAASQRSSGGGSAQARLLSSSFSAVRGASERGALTGLVGSWARAAAARASERASLGGGSTAPPPGGGGAATLTTAASDPGLASLKLLRGALSRQRLPVPFGRLTPSLSAGAFGPAAAVAPGGPPRPGAATPASSSGGADAVAKPALLGPRASYRSLAAAASGSEQDLARESASAASSSGVMVPPFVGPSPAAARFSSPARAAAYWQERAGALERALRARDAELAVLRAHVARQSMAGTPPAPQQQAAATPEPLMMAGTSGAAASIMASAFGPTSFDIGRDLNSSPHSSAHSSPTRKPPPAAAAAAPRRNMGGVGSGGGGGGTNGGAPLNGGDSSAQLWRGVSLGQWAAAATTAAGASASAADHRRDIDDAAPLQPSGGSVSFRVPPPSQQQQQQQQQQQ